MLNNNFKLFLENLEIKESMADKFFEKLYKTDFINILIKQINYLYNKTNDNYNDIKLYHNNTYKLKQDIQKNTNLIYTLLGIFNEEEINNTEYKFLENAANLINLFTNIIPWKDSIDHIYHDHIRSVKYFDKQYNTDFYALIEEFTITQDEIECLVTNIYKKIYETVLTDKHKAINILNNLYYDIDENISNEDIANLIFSTFMKKANYHLNNLDKGIFKHVVYNTLYYNVAPPIFKYFKIDINDIIDLCLIKNQTEVDWRPNEVTPEDYYAL